MVVTISELRQRLFALADQVIASGEPVLIERKGVQLQLARVDSVRQKSLGRLARLQPQSLVVGDALAPSESPADWSASPQAALPGEPAPEYPAAKTRSRKRPSS